MKRLFVLFFALNTACAEKKPSGSIAEKGGAIGAPGVSKSADGSSPAPVAEPALWTTKSAPLKLRCEPSGELGFHILNGLNETNKYMLARFAMLGAPALKFDDTVLQNYFKQAGFSSVKLLANPSKGVQGVVATSDKINLVVFRGTHSPAGVATDLNFMMSSGGFLNMPGGVHGGFKSAYESVQADVAAALDAAKRPGVPTYFVGHSLGGALAMIAAADGLAKGVNVEGLVTMGQPRTGNINYSLAFSSALKEKYSRYVFEDDPVPHLPPAPSAGDLAATALSNNNLLKLAVQSASLIRFAHVGSPLQLGQAKFATQKYDSDDLWDKNYYATNAIGIKDSVFSVLGSTATSSLEALANDNLVTDHDLEKYLCSMLDSAK
ncbi:MAG: lipase family protein [Silvanigrellaceae bacterium]